MSAFPGLSYLIKTLPIWFLLSLFFAPFIWNVRSVKVKFWHVWWIKRRDFAKVIKIFPQGRNGKFRFSIRE